VHNLTPLQLTYKKRILAISLLTQTDEKKGGRRCILNFKEYMNIAVNHASYMKIPQHLYKTIIIK
jgi:hypothetical protein